MDEVQGAPIPEAITSLWDKVKDALRACGDPSPRDIDRLAASCGLCLPSSTVEGWFRTWSVVPAWERFDVLIKALGAEQDQDWKALHAAAQLADRQRKTKMRQKSGRRGPVSTTAEAAGPEAENARASASAAQDDLGQLHVTARVTHLPVIRAKVGLDKSTIIFLLIGALLVVTAAAAFLSRFTPDQSGTDVKENSSPAVKPLAGSPPVVRELALPTRGQLRNTPPPPGAGSPNVLYVGDSIASETQAMMTFFVHRTGRARLVTPNHPFTAICDYFNDRGEASSVPPEDKLPALVRKLRPRVVVLQFWGISSSETPCTGGAQPGSNDYYRRYHADAQQAIRQIADAARVVGIDRPRIVWVLQGPDLDKARTHSQA